jgi:GTP pyrophosphokinase
MLVVSSTDVQLATSPVAATNLIFGETMCSGFETDQGLIIHRTSCPRAVDLMSNYGNRIVRAKWNDQLELVGRRVRSASDRVASSTTLRASSAPALKVNMRSISSTLTMA